VTACTKTQKNFTGVKTTIGNDSGNCDVIIYGCPLTGCPHKGKELYQTGNNHDRRATLLAWPYKKLHPRHRGPKIF